MALREIAAAQRALHGESAPLPPDEAARTEAALARVPYRNRQSELALSLPEPDAR